MSNKSLSKNASRFLRGIGHDLSPLVTVADKGLTENVMHEIEIGLNHHEIIKIKLRTDKESRKLHQDDILKNTGAVLIQAIGQTLTVYRRNQKKPIYELPK
ncbi:YhbY family RNA-binding protein [Marinicella sp. W31]|uniref:YhbY family RNA-binding protein n=1 Tax=Marinicella sp. W31 TaxID=3023713 RepID=UPI0037567649